MGNRGVLIDAQRRLVRDSQVRRWIACRLEFRGRHRTVMTPNTWTELFFLDELTALAAGHRPCAECRRADFRAFQSAWRQAFPERPFSADAMDLVLHAERRSGPWRKHTYVAAGDALPDGTFVAIDARAWLVQGDTLRAWTADGYDKPQPRPRGTELTVLTPASIVGVLRAGYRPGAHPTAAD
jgi:hypothetical protein